MLEGAVAEVQDRSMAFYGGNDWVFRHAEQVDDYISAEAARVSCFD